MLKKFVSKGSIFCAALFAASTMASLVSADPCLWYCDHDVSWLRVIRTQVGKPPIPRCGKYDQLQGKWAWTNSGRNWLTEDNQYVAVYEYAGTACTAVCTGATDNVVATGGNPSNETSLAVYQVLKCTCSNLPSE